MRVGVVAASKYPDMEGVRERLSKGAQQESVTLVVRKSDHRLKKLLIDLDAPRVEFWEAPKWMKDSTDGRANQFLVDVDHLLLFHVPSSTTDYFAKKARDYPYSMSFGPKTTIVEAAAPKKRRTKGRASE